MALKVECIQLEETPNRPWAEVDAWNSLGEFLPGIASRSALFANRKRETKPAYFRVRASGLVFRLVNKQSTLLMPEGSIQWLVGIRGAK